MEAGLEVVQAEAVWVEVVWTKTVKTGPGKQEDVWVKGVVRVEEDVAEVGQDRNLVQTAIGVSGKWLVVLQEEHRHWDLILVRQVSFLKQYRRVSSLCIHSKSRRLWKKVKKTHLERKREEKAFSDTQSSIEYPFRTSKAPKEDRKKMARKTS